MFCSFCMCVGLSLPFLAFFFLREKEHVVRLIGKDLRGFRGGEAKIHPMKIIL